MRQISFALLLVPGRQQPHPTSHPIWNGLDELFIDRMEGNEEIFSRVMTDKEFSAAAHEHLALEIFRSVREGKAE